MRMYPLLVVACLSACVPVPSPPISTLEVAPAAEIEPLRPGESLAVLADTRKESGWSTDCLTKHLEGALPEVRVIDDAAVRDAFFPWLEIAGSLPVTDTAVAHFLARPRVQAKVEELGLRYIFVVRHGFEQKGDGGEQGLAGAAFFKNTDRISMTAIDLQAACCRVGGKARAAGIVGYGHVVIYGFVLLSPTETAACSHLASALLAELRPAD